MKENVYEKTPTFSGGFLFQIDFTVDKILLCCVRDTLLIGSSQPLDTELAASSLLIRSSNYFFISLASIPLCFIPLRSISAIIRSHCFAIADRASSLAKAKNLHSSKFDLFLIGSQLNCAFGVHIIVMEVQIK